jgi:hypothetical protein
VPPGAGKVVAVEWDFEGLGTYPLIGRLDEPQEVVQVSTSHAYCKPGTYYPVVRATSQREGNVQTPYGRIQNIARARVVVH